MSMIRYKEAVSILQANEGMVEDFICRIMPIQDELNINITKNKNYAIELKTADGKRINYGNCIMDECSEVLNSIDWKHWKFGSNNINNLELELVDIIHFVASSIIVSNQLGYVTISDKIYNDIILSMKIDGDTILNLDNINHIDMLLFINSNISTYASILSCYYTILNSNNKHHPDGDIITSYNYGILVYTILCHMLLQEEGEIKLENTLNRMYAIYIVKNTLILFRVEHGYKDGSYIKVWDGLEDNEVALEIMTNNPDITKEELYTLLELKYKEILK